MFCPPWKRNKNWADHSLIYRQVYPVLNENVWGEQQGTSNCRLQIRLQTSMASRQWLALQRTGLQPFCNPPRPQNTRSVLSWSSCCGEKIDLWGMTDNEAAMASSHPAHTTELNFMACIYTHTHVSNHYLQIIHLSDSKFQNENKTQTSLQARVAPFQ